MQCLRDGGGIEPLGRQNQQADAAVVHAGLVVLIAAGEGIACRHLAIETATVGLRALRGRNGLGEWCQHREVNGIDDGIVLLIVVGSAHEEGRLPVDGAAQVAIQIEGVVRRLDRCVGIARVEDVVVAGAGEVAVQLVAAGLGEDFHAPEAERVVLRGVKVLVDAKLADGVLRREAAIGKAVDQDLRGLQGVAARHSQNLLLKGAVVIGEGLEIVSFEDKRTLVLGGGGAVIVVGGNGDLLGLCVDDKPGIDAGVRCSIRQRDVGAVRLKASGRDSDVVDSLRQRKAEAASVVGSGIALEGGALNVHVGVRDLRARRIGDGATENAVGCGSQRFGSLRRGGFGPSRVVGGCGKAIQRGS